MAKFNVSKISMKWRIVLAFAAIYVIWGSTYLAIRLAIATIPPYLMGGMRFLIAGEHSESQVSIRCRRTCRRAACSEYARSLVHNRPAG